MNAVPKGADEPNPDGNTAADKRQTRMAVLSGEVLANSEVLSEMGAKVREQVDELLSLLIRIERAIVMADRALRIAQPPIQGKVGVRWWKLTGAAKVRTPVLVKWQRVRGGRWRGKRLGQVRHDTFYREGSAALCADRACEIARSAQRLIAQYDSLRKVLADAARNLARATATFDTTDRAEAAILSEYQGVLDTLTAAGYDVDPAVRSMPDRYLAGGK